MRPSITVVSGPAGVGKGTVVREVCRLRPEVWVSVSATTRAPRPGEVDGTDYLFCSDEEFDQLVEGDGLLEWAAVHGRHRYGTPSEPVFAAHAAGRPVILEIDLAGARQVRDRLPGAQFAFIAPPDWGTLVSRLEGRGTETPAQVERRLETARIELMAAVEFDRTIVNDDVARAAVELVDFLSL